jgi:carbamate kinase
VRIVVGVGGNALLRRGEAPTIGNQRRNVDVATEALAPVVRAHDVVLTHGNGPQVGLLALQDAAGDPELSLPLDALGAQTEGLIGHVLAASLRTRLPELELAVLLTQVRIDADDPGFEAPTKPIGPTYDQATARRLARDRGWTIAEDTGGWRRTVPSPRPLEVLELPTVRRLVDAGVTVVCAGGGGIPVTRGPSGALRGLEAVIDKDATSRLLAEALRADLFMLLTDVDALYRGFGTPRQTPIDRISAAELTALAAELPAGSIAPKARACAEFVAATGGRAAIGALEAAADVVAGTAGTHVVP